MTLTLGHSSHYISVTPNRISVTRTLPLQGVSMSENLKHGPHIFKSKAAAEEEAAGE